MKEEYFDVVDENNQPLGIKKLRSEVHRDGDWHRTVHIYFFNQEDGIRKYLVHLRAKDKDVSPNRWDTRFGGHLQAEDSFETAAVKEVKDEVGLDVSLDDLIEGEIYKRQDKAHQEFTKVYYYQFRGDAASLKFNDGEVQAVKWVSKDEIEKSIRENPEQWAPRPEGFLKINSVLDTKLREAL